MAQQLGKINKRHKGKIMVPSLSIVSEQASACLLFVVFVYGASYNYFLAATGALGQKLIGSFKRMRLCKSRGFSLLG